jgi:hypothetical protein
VLSVVTSGGSTESGSLIDEIVRDGARRMLAAALEAEVNQYIAELAAERDERGHRLVVRNGHHRPRTVVTAAGPVEVTAPRGTGSPAAAPAMVFKLVESAQDRWRAITGAHLVSLVRARCPGRALGDLSSVVMAAGQSANCAPAPRPFTWSFR